MFASVKPLLPSDMPDKFEPLRRFLRVTALTLVILLSGEAVPAPVYASAAVAVNGYVATKAEVARRSVKQYEVMQDLRRKMAMVTPADFKALSTAPRPGFGPTIIDEIGRLSQPVPQSDAAEWRSALKIESASTDKGILGRAYFAQRRVWLGEYLLAVDQAPIEAEQQLRDACALTTNADPLHGTALYDLGLCVFYQHDFEASVDYYRHMLKEKPEPAGLDRANASLMLRHAIACLGYHKGNARLGIPEPPVLDPLCGAASLAASLRSLNLAYDRGTVLAHCRVTEEGSSLQDLIDAGRKLGAAVYPLSADERGLILLPKPAIAFVEQDHFVSVVHADSKGVSYLCSDCGAWPGGQVHLTWKQWRNMQPGQYAAVVRHGSTWDQFLSKLPTKQHYLGSTPAASADSVKFVTGVEVCSLPSNNELRLTSLTSQLLPIGELVTHIAISNYTPTAVACGNSAESTHCSSCCPEASGGPGGKGSAKAAQFAGPSSGDPVNLATGEEEYAPAPDLKVYNPIGPSVTWGRIYNSLRSAYNETWYEFQDYGQGWSQNYNLGVNDPTNGGSGPYARKYIYNPNGSRIYFTAPNPPTAGNPIVQCSVAPGYAYLVTWNYNSGNGTTYYIITDSQRNQYVTSPINSTSLCSVLTQVIDRNGNAINFNYSAPVSEYSPYVNSWPLLTSITDSNGTPLLVINRVQDGTGAIASVDDRYGRTVYYHVGYYRTVNVASGWPQYLFSCDHVSQIEPTDTPNPPDRYHYGYSLITNSEGAELVPKLTGISVPNPSGSTTPATATIEYDPTYSTVSALIDANGNEMSFASVDQNGNPANNSNYTKTTVTGASMQPYSYISGFNSNLSPLSKTDGAGNPLQTIVYDDPNDPLGTSTVTDGAGNSINFTFDAFGNVTTITTGRGTRTVDTWSYSTFALGELLSKAEGSKTPTTFTYYEPSGLLKTASDPAPGTSGNGDTVTYTYSYDSLGDQIAVTGPGAVPGQNYTTTYNYAADGSFAQSPAIGQPVSIVSPDGRVKHYRYDGQRNRIAAIDGLGNETDFTYNIANQEVSLQYPATGETGTGRCRAVANPLYPGGPKSVINFYNESGALDRVVTSTYGNEGELLSRTGMEENTSFVYDGLYRTKSELDGKLNATNYYYDAQGYTDSVTLPGYTGPTPAYNTSTGTWSNVSGTDSIRYWYDADGRVTKRIDGRGLETDCLYYDPTSKLTDIEYPSDTADNVHFTYDAYGREASKASSHAALAYSYDDRGIPTSVTTSYPGLSAVTETFSYNPDTTKSAASFAVGSSSYRYNYSYDEDGQVTGLTNPDNNHWTWSYAANYELEQQVQVESGLTSNFAYDARGYLTGASNVIGENVVSSYSGMTYDTQGDRLAVTTDNPNWTQENGTTTYSYDAIGELTDEVNSSSAGQSQAYQWDQAGNPTEYGSTTNTFNSDNQNTATAFDGDGNQTARGGAALQFNPANRMTSYGSTVAATYQPDGLRASKTAGGTTTYFVYEGLSPVLELNASSGITAVNTFGPTGLLSRHAASAVQYTFDPNQNVAQQLDFSGNILCNYTNTAFGTRSASSTNSEYINDPFTGFKGQEGSYYDPETGLTLCGERYYDPTTGRFINRDPTGTAGGVNLYESCTDNPVLYSDPSGEDSITGTILGCAASANTTAIMGVLAALESGDTSSLSSVMCGIGASCLAAIFGYVVGLLCTSLPGGAACYGGFATGLAEAYMDYLCSPPPPCSSLFFLACSAVTVIVDTVTGCISGLKIFGADEIKNSLRAIIMNNIVDALVGGDAGEYCGESIPQ